MKGIGASPGIAIGQAFVIKKQEYIITGKELQSDIEKENEKAKFEAALKTSLNEVEIIKAQLSEKSTEFEIMEVQSEFLQDDQVREDVINKIFLENKPANDALLEVLEATKEIFKNLDSAYHRERIADVEDNFFRILKYLNGNFSNALQNIKENTILIAEDILPADTITLDISKIIGFVTRMGGKTSHAAIVAKSKGIPAIVGCGDSLAEIVNNDQLIIDGSSGVIIKNPTTSEITTYTKKQNDFTEQITLLNQLKFTKAQTIDGVEIKLLANISNAEDWQESLNYGAEGCGLFRTELLFMGRTTMPTEEEQFEFYKAIAIHANDKPIIVRTLDIGGDKQLPYFNLPREENPFLGYRAIRICLDQPAVFIAQLKAILRASAFGHLKIMFPMISNLSEIKEAKDRLEEAKQELASKQIVFNRQIEVGIMIEIPSAAIMSDILAKEVDFFSIGTNDLCQYTLAVDRRNEKIKHLYDPYNPGVLRLIQMVIENAQKYGKHCGMCGELAGDELATLLLLGLGLREFSMSASSIPFVKNQILKTSIAEAKEISDKVMAMENSADIINYLNEVKKR